MAFTNPMSHEFWYQSSTQVHQVVMISRHHTSKPVWYPTSSVKKAGMNKRKEINTGLKIKFAMGVSKDIGKPHAMSSGNEINERNSCSSIK